MKIAVLQSGKGIDAITLREASDPAPGPGEALVRITAATLNFRDIIMAKGLLPGLAKEPDVIPLSCAAGEVVAVGEGTTRVKVGDRVSPQFTLGWIDGAPGHLPMLGGNADGVARELAVFDAEHLVKNLDEIGDLEAATLPCAGLTAWSALFGGRPLQAGEWVLVQGTGGVSIAALQWAKAAGANVVVTSSSDTKLRRARALGADVTVNYRSTPDWPAEVRKAVGGVDILVDVVGASEVERSAALLNEGGAIAAIGMLDGPFSWDRQEIGGHKVMPIGVGRRGQHEDMLAFIARHGVRPVVDVVYPFDRLVDAYRCLEGHDFFGKVAVTLA